MAIATTITMTVRDAKTALSTVSFYVPVATEEADVDEYAQSAATYVDALIGGQIIKVQVTRQVDISGLGLQAQPNANTDVEEGAKFIFGTALPGVTREIRLPTINEVIFTPGSQVVDLTNADVISFVDHMVDPYTATSTNTVSGSDYREDDLTQLLSAREDFTKTRKRV